MWQILKLTQSKVQRKSGTRYHQDILLYWEKWAVGKPLQTCLEGTWTGLGSKLHCSCSPVEGNVPFLKQPCCSRKESHFPLKEIIKCSSERLPVWKLSFVNKKVHFQKFELILTIQVIPESIICRLKILLKDNSNEMLLAWYPRRLAF